MVAKQQKNYKDPNLRDVARQKAITAMAPRLADQPKYRDRASERRIMHNQPDAPLPMDQDNLGKKKHADGPIPVLPPPLPINPGEDESNVGNKLLKMMGWKEGTGLGTSGEGRLEPMFVCISCLSISYSSDFRQSNVYLCHWRRPWC
jgi:RNA-binding protein 5/10